MTANLECKLAIAFSLCAFVFTGGVLWKMIVLALPAAAAIAQREQIVANAKALFARFRPHACEAERG